MHPVLAGLLVCPSCAGTLDVQAFERAGPRVVEGVLLCPACDLDYPVIGGIPRMLLGGLGADLPAEHPAFFARHGTRVRLAATESGTDRLQLRTARSFGYEWSSFPEMLAAYEQNYRWYMEPLEDDAFAGRLVLDAGCGTGRHAFYTARRGATVVAVDLSRAVDVAAHNNRDHEDAHFVQADLTRLPFPPRSFDLVYSFGVLHHLPDPEPAFRRLLQVLRPGGAIRIYLYWSLETEGRPTRLALRLVTASRRLTTRLPHPVLRLLTLGVAAAFQVGFVLPYRVLSRTAATRGIAERIPLRQYAQYPFRVLHTDQFDRFSAPIENRYTRAEVQGWFERAGLEDVTILGGLGWRAMGRRPAAP